MTNDQLDELERLAKAATPGRWLYRPHTHDDWGWVKADVGSDWRGPIIAISRGDPADERSHDECRAAKADPYERNGRYIAALNPAAVLELIAAARASSVGMSEANAQKIPPPNAGEGDATFALRQALDRLQRVQRHRDGNGPLPQVEAAIAMIDKALRSNSPEAG